MLATSIHANEQATKHNFQYVKSKTHVNNGISHSHRKCVIMYGFVKALMEAQRYFWMRPSESVDSHNININVCTSTVCIK